MCGSKRVWVSELIFILLVVKGWWSEGCLEQERSALLQLKRFFNGDLRLQNWVDDEYYLDCCLWEGVECNNTTGRVIKLDLAQTRNWESEEWYMNASLFTPFQQLESLDLIENNIAGCVENEGLEKLSRLNNLKFLHLDYNSFNNSIFSSLGGLSSLRHLSLFGNRLNGSIDIKGLESLSNLEELDMSDNAIDNLVVPKGLERLSRLNNLKCLFLDNNYFNNSIFSSLGGLSSLKRLSLAGNELNGSIDIEGLESLSNLEELDMSDNAIDNLVVPKGLERLSRLNNLKFLYLDDNYFNNSTFSSLGGLDSLSNLEELNMRANAIDNLVVPKELHNFTNLEGLILYKSDLHVSQLLPSIASFTSLKYLSMLDSVLKGALHGQDFRKFKNLEHLDMGWVQVNVNTSFFQIVGKSMSSLKFLSLTSSSLNKNAILDQGLCQLVHLQELYIGRNDLRGSLPWCLANMTSLQVLDASSNQLTGNISPGLCELVLLRELYIDYNDLRGSLPWCLANMTSLQVLNASYNQLTGNISPGLCELVLLRELYIDYNDFGGSLRWCLANTTSLQVLDASCNQLIGNISPSLCELVLLRELYIDNNDLRGSLPLCLANLTSLRVLDVSYNQLSENISSSLMHLMLMLKSARPWTDQILSPTFMLSTVCSNH
ncbi:hypothetical protein CUMW_239870 [Citrus unshiu]|uniref:Leucine-rich repeat-containing N-terminal plant-type domain-containing protein n=1 Tax=Citrus unshiu TaxID=55188 RepID=A0A2H5QKX9_CITUN|nr:hypothetical protein CUMW_239870 [Citrus unshiu]